MGTVVVAAALVLVIGLAVRSMIKDKKNGKSLCGGKCSCCPNGCACHGEIKSE